MRSLLALVFLSLICSHTAGLPLYEGLLYEVSGRKHVETAEKQEQQSQQQQQPQQPQSQQQQPQQPQSQQQGEAAESKATAQPATQSPATVDGSQERAQAVGDAVVSNAVQLKREQAMTFKDFAIGDGLDVFLQTTEGADHANAAKKQSRSKPNVKRVTPKKTAKTDPAALKKAFLHEVAKAASKESKKAKSTGTNVSKKAPPHALHKTAAQHPSNKRSKKPAAAVASANKHAAPARR